MIGELNKKRGVADPCDTDFPLIWGMWNGFTLCAVSLVENLWKQAVAQKVVITFGPAFFGKDACVVCSRITFGLIGYWVDHDC